ncbi:MAG: hypothetical protein F4Y97_09410 [Dehalococcoidia bacterium]|nr:hypothetical protein [Dehalococcoidia bacterium]
MDPKVIPMKGDPRFDERWLHDQLKERPALLGLGDLDVRDSERQQPSGGRLDLLLTDSERVTRYEVEIQLGATDESHIIRTIEYWDIERRRYPQYEHVAVIAAEQVTSRFLNVIHLFNGAIPLIALQLQLVDVGGAHTLIASRILDRVRLATDEEDEATVVDRAWWQEKSSSAALAIVDDVIAQTNEKVGEAEEQYEPKYNKHYIGLSRNGKTTNFITLRPRKKHIIAEFKIPEDEGTTNTLEEAGLDVITYDSRWGNYRIRLGPGDRKKYREQLDPLTERAHKQYHS